MSGLNEMAELTERCIVQNQGAAATAEAVQGLASFGPEVWEPLSPVRHSYGDFYAALANALLFVNEIELAELRRVGLPLPQLLVSVRKRWSLHQQRFTFSCVAGVSDSYSYTTVGQVHEIIQAELRGEPLF